VLAKHLAITTDANGIAHVAVSGRVHRSSDNGPVLLVGDNRAGKWTFEEIDRDVAGDVAVAVDKGFRHVAYFGAKTFKVARVCP